MGEYVEHVQVGVHETWLVYEQLCMEVVSGACTQVVDKSSSGFELRPEALPPSLRAATAAAAWTGCWKLVHTTLCILSLHSAQL